MAAGDYTKTRVGMLLLDPDGPYVWAVTGPRTLVRISGGVDAKATLTHSAVPPEWKVIDSDALAGLLRMVASNGASIGGQDLSFLFAWQAIDLAIEDWRIQLESLAQEEGWHIGAARWRACGCECYSSGDGVEQKSLPECAFHGGPFWRMVPLEMQ